MLFLSILAVGLLTGLALAILSARRWPRMPWLRYLLLSSLSLALLFALTHSLEIGWKLWSRKAFLDSMIARAAEVVRTGDMVEGRSSTGTMTWRIKVYRWDEDDTQAVAAFAAIGGLAGLLFTGIRVALARRRDARRRAAHICLKCGYPLQPIVQLRCPECGLEASNG